MKSLFKIEVILILLAISSCTLNTSFTPSIDVISQNAPVILVLIKQNVDSFDLKLDSDYRIAPLSDAFNQITPKSGNFLPLVKVIPHEKGILVGNDLIHDDNIEIETSDDGTIRIDGDYYRGTVIVKKDETGKLDVINKVNIEKYLIGVLGSEVKTSWPMPALEAQMIAARSYALYKMKVNKNRSFHVYTDTRDQAYHGMTKEDPVSIEVADRTRGVVLLYNWQLFPSYYHSTCGGYTADVSIVFREKSIPPLSGNIKCDYCTDSPMYVWDPFIIKESEIITSLKNNGYNIGRIGSITKEGSGPGGHGGNIIIKHDKGVQPLIISAEDFRHIAGARRMKSTSFEIEQNGSDFRIFNGKGYGHGIGMCQWGAKGLADEGYSCVGILNYYYRGADVVRVY